MIYLSNNEVIGVKDFKGVKLILENTIYGFYDSSENYVHYVAVKDFVRCEFFNAD